jgi:hypothetical protein
VSAPDESIPVAEAAAMGDTIHDVLWLVVAEDHRWCDVCLHATIRTVVRRVVEIDPDGGKRSDFAAGYCFGHHRFVEATR